MKRILAILTLTLSIAVAQTFDSYHFAGVIANDMNEIMTDCIVGHPDYDMACFDSWGSVSTIVSKLNLNMGGYEDVEPINAWETTDSGLTTRGYALFDGATRHMFILVVDLYDGESYEGQVGVAYMGAYDAEWNPID